MKKMSWYFCSDVNVYSEKSTKGQRAQAELVAARHRLFTLEALRRFIDETRHKCRILDNAFPKGSNLEVEATWEKNDGEPWTRVSVSKATTPRKEIAFAMFHKVLGVVRPQQEMFNDSEEGGNDD